MAENEKKTPDEAVTDAAPAPETKPEKKDAAKPAKKSGKPSVFSRALAWCRTTKAEMKKIVWTPRKTVLRNTILTLVVMAVSGAVIGLLDYVFSSAIVGLSLII